METEAPTFFVKNLISFVKGQWNFGIHSSFITNNQWLEFDVQLRNSI